MSLVGFITTNHSVSSSWIKGELSSPFNPRVRIRDVVWRDHSIGVGGTSAEGFWRILPGRIACLRVVHGW